MGDVPVVIFEVLHPPSHTVDTHAGISLNMTRIIKVVSSKITLYEDLTHSTPVE
jgi:hypothetical protein